MDEKKVKFEKDFSLNLGALEQKRIYGFTYENFENDILKRQIFYEVEVVFLSDRYGNNCVFEINRKKVFINNQKSRSHLEKIADDASLTIFPLRIKTKKSGEIEKILNHDLIKQRWEETKIKLLEYYKGEKVLKVIAKIEAVFLNEHLLEKGIQYNWFFHLFFIPLYVSYTEKLKYKSIWKSPVFGNQCIEYDVVHTIKEHYSIKDKIDINIDGIAIDERTLEEIMLGYNFSQSKFSDSKSQPVKSRMSVDYRLYAEDRSIYSIEGTFETHMDENKKQKIQLEIYHLPDSSSFRPWSDLGQNESQIIFEPYQKFDENDKSDYFFDLSKELKENPTKSIPEKVYTGQPIELFVEEIHLEMKVSFWSKIKLIFKKENKKV